MNRDPYARFGDYQDDEYLCDVAPRTDGSYPNSPVTQRTSPLWWVAAVLVAVGGFLLIASYEPTTGADSSIVWSSK